jgi:hypothetical protein
MTDGDMKSEESYEEFAGDLFLQNTTQRFENELFPNE